MPCPCLRELDIDASKKGQGHACSFRCLPKSILRMTQLFPTFLTDNIRCCILLPVVTRFDGYWLAGV